MLIFAGDNIALNTDYIIQYSIYQDCDGKISILALVDYITGSEEQEIYNDFNTLEEAQKGLSNLVNYIARDGKPSLIDTILDIP